MASTTPLTCFRALRKYCYRNGRVTSIVCRGSKVRIPIVNQCRLLNTSQRCYADIRNAETVPTADPGSLPREKRLGSANAAKVVKALGVGAPTTYTAYGVTEVMLKYCSKQADYVISQASNPEIEMPKTDDGEDLGVGDGWWNTELGLRPGFSTWSQITMLHMYLLSVRFRCFPSSESQPWLQHLLDHFFHEAENKMIINHNMHARGTRNKYLKDLFVQWRGLLAAYDEGIMKGDPVLASAIWRNVFKASEEVDIQALATIVSYMRRSLRLLDGLSDSEIMSGAVDFGSPKGDVNFVLQKSQLMNVALKEGRSEDTVAK